MDERNSGGELVELYLSESEQLTDRFEKLMLDSDADGELKDVSELFRILHTVKGSSATMDYLALADTAHSFEDIMAVVKNTGYKPDKDMIKAIIDAGLLFAEFFRKGLSAVRSGGVPERDSELEALIAVLADKTGAKGDNAPVGYKPPHAGSGKSAGKEGEIRLRIMLKDCTMPHIRAFIIARSITKLCTSFDTEPDNLEKNTAYDDIIKREGFIVKFVPFPGDTGAAVIKKLSVQPFVASCEELVQTVAAGNVFGNAETDDIFRNVTVAQSVVNGLVDYIRDIASAENALEAYINAEGVGNGHMRELLSKLRYTVAGAGMLASGIGTHGLEGVFMQMQRTVRGIAKDTGKSIRVRTSGEDVRVDKSILELLSDSLIHIVRNAADHGIENPASRAALGKPETGLITMTAVSKNGYLYVSVADDGAGIDKKAVLDKAAHTGRLTKPSELYTDSEVFRLLLSSCISTNTDVTKYSGRGVGLDTVMKRVRQAGGNLSLESREGTGTVFTLRIPLTLLITEGIEVGIGNVRIIIPVNSVEHLHDCSASPLTCSVQGNTNVIAHDGGFYRELCFPGGRLGSVNADKGYVILFMRDYGRFFIRVDTLDSITSHYIKAMPRYVSDATGRDSIFSGCAVCADSSLRCVLDVGKLIDLAEPGEISERPVEQ